MKRRERAYWMSMGAERQLENQCFAFSLSPLLPFYCIVGCWGEMEESMKGLQFVFLIY
jgi:hypothetical protein